MNAKIHDSLRCQATTSEGKRCKFSRSAEVGGKMFCGNHAALVKKTQLFDREPKVTVQNITAQHSQGSKSVFPTDPRASAESMIDTLFRLEDSAVPHSVMVQMLLAWKADLL